MLRNSCVIAMHLAGALLTSTVGAQDRLKGGLDRTDLSGARAAAEHVLVGPTADGSLTLRSVAAMLPQYHISRQPLNDDVSRRWLRNFLRSLDGNKLYFLQSDIDNFFARQDELDDLARAGTLSFAYDIFNVFRERVAERTDRVEALVNELSDFTADDSYTTDYELAQYAADKNASDTIWRKQLKYDLLKLKLERVNLEAARLRIVKRYQAASRDCQASDDEDLLEAFLTALARAYDSQSAYVCPKKLQEFAINSNQQFEGVGIQMLIVDGEVEVTRVVPGGPAAKEGHLKAGDHILAIGQGESGDFVPVSGLRLLEVTKMCRGKAGTICCLQVAQRNETEPILVSITREKVQMQDTQSAILQRGAKADGTPLRFGYIHVPTLYASGQQGPGAKTASRDVRSILEDAKTGMRKAGIDVVIFDLRNNTGGAINEAISALGLFIGSGPVTQVKGFDRNTKSYDCNEILSSWDGPLIVLTSYKTASGAELVAAALQDYGRALVVGDATTAGAGSIQTVYDVGVAVSAKNPPKLGSVSITGLQFYRINGDSTQVRGVIPDVILPSSTDPPVIISNPNAPILGFDRVAPIERAKNVNLSADQKAELQKRSDARRGQSEAFRRLIDIIAKRDASNKLKVVSLNEDKALEQLQGRLGSVEVLDDSLFEPGFYNDEVLGIARDYLEMLKASK
jgi:carboxyl-terminal processing protease